MTRSRPISRKMIVKGAVAGFILFLLPILWAAISIASFEDLKESYLPSDRVLVDRQGQVLHESRQDFQVRRLEWVEVQNVNPGFISTLLKAEDRRFYFHPGVDLLSLLRASWLWMSSQNSRRGASTLSMQTVHLMDRQLQQKKMDNRYLRKLRQIFWAMGLELRYSKEEILESYLNLAPFRGELEGLSAASFGLFKKSPRRLNELDSIVLVSLIRAPNAPIVDVASRAQRLCDDVSEKCPNMREHLEVLERSYSVRRPTQKMPALAELAFKKFSKHSNVRTTIDPAVQEFAQKAIKAHVKQHMKQNMKDGAVIVLDNKSGEVLAYVSNTQELASAQYVDGVQALRQAGSVLKPFLYGEAIARKLVTAATLIDDSATDVSVQTGVYSPQNYDEKFHGLVTVRKALSNSLNVPAVKVIGFLGGAPEFLKSLKSFGITSALQDDFYGPSLALGAIEIRLIEIANAYRALANQGEFTDYRLFHSNEDREAGRQVLKPASAFIVADILSDRISRSESFGMENALTTRFWSAAKTGTSKDMRDNWCIGFSSRYTVAVWAGNFSGEPMWNVSGVDGAAPVWKAIMVHLHRDLASEAPKPPEGLKSKEVTIEAGGRKTQEWFLPDTEPRDGIVKSVELNHHKILSPVHAERFALHPDTPKQYQKIAFQFATKDPKVFVFLNGQKLGSAAQEHLWSPVPGQHRLTLRASDGNILDSVTFSVR